MKRNRVHDKLWLFILHSGTSAAYKTLREAYPVCGKADERGDGIWATYRYAIRCINIFEQCSRVYETWRMRARPSRRRRENPKCMQTNKSAFKYTYGHAMNGSLELGIFMVSKIIELTLER